MDIIKTRKFYLKNIIMMVQKVFKSLIVDWIDPINSTY